MTVLNRSTTNDSRIISSDSSESINRTNPPIRCRYLIGIIDLTNFRCYMTSTIYK